MRPTRILAVVVAAVLGVGLGVTAGIALDRGYQDPLGLDAPMVNQDCQPKKALLVLASSDTADGLGPSLSANSDARYLETASSCETTWRPQGKPTLAYVVYLGPFSSREACEMRMTGEHRGDQVTLLTARTTDTVQCLCYVSYENAPTLRTTPELSDLEVVYLNALQRLLTTMGRRPDIPTTDSYDQRTVSEVRAFQQYVGRLGNGVVDPLTWKDLQDRGCRQS